MAKILNITEENIKGIISEFAEYLKNGVKNGMVEYKKLCTVDKKAELIFSEAAWIKMQALIHSSEKEVGWHGSAYRDTEKPCVYHIEDIWVYPQEVTGATVNTDQEEYTKWLYSDDERMKNLRMHGHSHVEMGVSPSSVDTVHQNKIIEQLEPDMFYIFLIWNKRNERYIKIIDEAENTMFESSDVVVTVKEDVIGMPSFMKEAKELVQERKPVYALNTYTKVGNYSQVSYKSKTDKQSPAQTYKKHNKKPAKDTYSKYGYDYEDDDAYADDPYSAFGYR